MITSAGRNQAPFFWAQNTEPMPAGGVSQRLESAGDLEYVGFYCRSCRNPQVWALPRRLGIPTLRCWRCNSYALQPTTAVRVAQSIRRETRPVRS